MLKTRIYLIIKKDSFQIFTIPNIIGFRVFDVQAKKKTPLKQLFAPLPYKFQVPRLNALRFDKSVKPFYSSHYGWCFKKH